MKNNHMNHTGDIAMARIREEAEKWWLHLRSGKATTEDAQALRAWCAQSHSHAAAWREIRDIWEALEPATQSVHAREVASSVVPKRNTGGFGRRAFIGGAFAVPAVATLAILPPLGLWPSAAVWAADYHTGTGEQRQVVLSSEVMMTMNTQTKINRKNNSRGEGIELLSGEAEISVKQAVPFIVDVGGGTVLAHAAQFNVRYTNDEVCVTCLSGRLEVATGASQKVLQAGNQLLYGKTPVTEVIAADVSGVTAWRQGTLSFTDAPLHEVIAEINRYRSGRVILNNQALAERRVRLRFSTQQMDSAVRMIGELYNLRLIHLPAGVVLLT
jgi:transmembrane sensor